MNLDRLDAESSQLFEALLGPSALPLIGILVGLWLATFAVQALINNAKRLPLASRTLSQLALQTGALTVSAALIVWHFYTRAPHTVELFVVATLVLLGIGVGLKGRNWVFGLSVLFRGSIRVEDRLTIGDIEGVVVSLHPFRINLRNAGGGTVFLPVSRLAEEPFSVASLRRTFPVEVQIQWPSPVTVEVLTAFFRVSWLCPYRQESSEVFVDLVSDDPHRVMIRFRAWSSSAAERAKMFLRKHAEDLKVADQTSGDEA